MSTKNTISIVVPVLNEFDSIPLFIERLRTIFSKISTVDYEIVFVDDGSTDDSFDLLKNCGVPEVKVVKLSRNFGKEIALSAGLDVASGDAVIPMDVDLQDPPELIPEMIEKFFAGYDVVQPVRVNRPGDSYVKKVSAKSFYWILSKISTTLIPQNVGDFQLLSRRVIVAIKQYPERTRFMKGIIATVGFKRIQIPFVRPCRCAGSSKFNYWRLWNFALDGITAFSTLPLRVWTYVGASVALFSFLWAFWLIFKTMYFGVVTPGYASLFASVLFLGGLQLMGIGVVGEYVGRISVEARQRPLYHIDETHNIND